MLAFSGYDLTDATPDHSNLFIIRQRVGTELCEEVFRLILQAEIRPESEADQKGL